MLFDEAELQELDKLNKKEALDHAALAQKPAPKIKHWIAVNAGGMLSILKYPDPSDKINLVFLEVESKQMAQKILDIVPGTQKKSLYAKGNYFIPNWQNTPSFSGFCAMNLFSCNSWLSKMITLLGYDLRNSYKILHEPSDLAMKAHKNSSYAQNAQQNQQIIDEALKLSRAANREKQEIETQMMDVKPSSEQLKNIRRSF